MTQGFITGPQDIVFSGTDGQVFTGVTGGEAVFANVSPGSGITITEGAGSLGIAAQAAATPGVSNIGIAYNGGTGVFTVQGADGTALSASNPGYVTLQSKSTSGQLVTIAITANQSFIDDTGASEIVGNLFGVTTAIAYDSDIPFFLYAVSNDDEDAIALMISRIPHRKVAPAIAFIGAPDDAVASTQGSFFSLENIDETLYDENPCLLVGAFRMRKLTTANDWTVQALSASDGIGQFHDQTAFVMLEGTFGALAGTYWVPNSGTEPTFGTQSYFYYIKKDGRCFFSLRLRTCNNTPAGAYDLAYVIPFANSNAISLGDIIGHYIGGSNTTRTTLGILGGTGQSVTDLAFEGLTTNMANGSFSTGYTYYSNLTYQTYIA